MEFKFCNSSEQLADIFTKPLKVDTFVKLKRKLGMISVVELGLREAM